MKEAGKEGNDKGCCRISRLLFFKNLLFFDKCVDLVCVFLFEQFLVVEVLFRFFLICEESAIDKDASNYGKSRSSKSHKCF